MKKTLIIASIVAFGMAVLGMSVGPISVAALIPLGLALFVGSTLIE